MSLNQALQQLIGMMQKPDTDLSVEMLIILTGFNTLTFNHIIYIVQAPFEILSHF